MSIITNEVRSEWKEIIQPYLQGADAQDLTIRVAGAQGLGTREWPTNRAEFDDVLNRVETACEAVIPPHVCDECSSKVLINELCAVLGSHLLEELEARKSQAQQDVPSLESQLGRSRAHILRSDVEGFQITVSQNVANALRYDPDSTVERETVDALVRNLGHNQGLVRRTAAKALSEAAKQNPAWIRAHLDEICRHTTDSSTNIGCLSTLLWTLEYGDPSCKEMTAISEAAGESLHAESEECQHTAAKILQQIVKEEPEAIPPETIDELLDMRVQPDPILGEIAVFILNTLDRDVGLSHHEYDPEPTFKRSTVPHCISSQEMPIVPNLDFDNEPSNSGLTYSPWPPDDSSTDKHSTSDNDLGLSL